MTMLSSQDLCAHLAALDIDYTRVDHAPVFTCEEAEIHVPATLPGARTKNLFLRDKKGTRHLLVVASQERRIDLKALAAALDTQGLSFASDQRLMAHLGVAPGSVSILALANDTARAVELVVDGGVWRDAAIQAHPLVNTATLVVSRPDLDRFLAGTGHEARVIDVPEAA